MMGGTPNERTPTMSDPEPTQALYPHGIDIHIVDPATGGEVEIIRLKDDVLVLVHGTHYVASAQGYATGTKVFTVKVEK
jgi:hypothetical protein